MNDEGVIKYRLVFQQAEPLLNHDYSNLDKWHRYFKAEQVLGQDPARYGGLGFGNLSQRIDQRSFLISGTQTGGLEQLSAEHYALVTHVDLEKNSVEARGSMKPSSESLTHAAVYSLNAGTQFVFHVHSPEIWHARDDLNMAKTSDDIAYGTADMAQEVFRLYQQGQFKNGNILAMSGHEDGVISFGDSADEAGEIIIDTLRIARQGN